jgi:cobalamin biosynthesis Co2+ chelatase CbiK
VGAGYAGAGTFHGVDVWHHDTVRAPIQDALDEIRMDITDADDNRGWTSAQCLQRLKERLLSHRAVLQIDEEPVKAT